MTDQTTASLARLGSFLHGLSRLALLFVPAALFFQVRAFRAAFWSAVGDRAQIDRLRHALATSPEAPAETPSGAAQPA